MSLHPLHRAWRMLPAAVRRAAFARSTAFLAPRPDATPPPARGGMVVAGELGRASGLGEGARLMIAGLRQLGIETVALEAEVAPPGLGGGAVRGDSLPEGAPLLLHINPPMLAAALLRLGRALTANRRIIGHFAWELPAPPPSWRAGARLVHDIWVPSRFTAEALRPLHPRPPVVVPYPIAADPPVPSGLTRADFALPPDAVIVLVSFSLASSYARKNPEAAIAAFRAAFGSRTDRLLLLKIAHADHAPDDLARLRALADGAPNIRIETRLFGRSDRDALTAAADIVLSTHRSEGFGLVVAEAMWLGRPVVATDYAATAEFFDASAGIPVPFRMIPAVDPRGVFEVPGAAWADIDVAAAAAALRALADDPGRRAALGAAASEAARRRFTLDPLRDAVAALGLSPA